MSIPLGLGALNLCCKVDAQIPHTASEAWTRELGYGEAISWRPWLAQRTDRGVALRGLVLGYTVRYDRNFTFATIKGAGHMVPKYRPAAIRIAFERYIRSRSLL